MKSYIQRLDDELEIISRLFAEFINDLKIIKHVKNPGSQFAFIMPPYYYDTNLSPQQKNRQIELFQKYSEWEQHFNMLSLNMPEAISTQIKECEKFLKEKIDLISFWDTSPESSENVERMIEKIAILRDLLKLRMKDGLITLIPDTNSLIIDPEFEKYKAIGGEEFSIIISPTVLSELDKLKIQHRDESFRQKINSVIARIKGLRAQGSLINGVIVHKSITIKMSAKEPSFENTLSWLDSSNNDDRIIAFALEYMRNAPSDKVILVTTDINLQNKAEMAKIPYSEPPTKIWPVT